MNGCLGGAATAKRDSKMTVASLGPFPATVTTPDGTIIDYKLKPGDTQSMVFNVGDSPPFYYLNRPRVDAHLGKTKKVQVGGPETSKKKSRPGSLAVALATAAYPTIDGGSATAEEEQVFEQQAVATKGFEGARVCVLGLVV